MPPLRTSYSTLASWSAATLSCSSIPLPCWVAPTRWSSGRTSPWQEYLRSGWAWSSRSGWRWPSASSTPPSTASFPSSPWVSQSLWEIWNLWQGEDTEVWWVKIALLSCYVTVHYLMHLFYLMHFTEKAPTEFVRMVWWVVWFKSVSLFNYILLYCLEKYAYK